MCVALTDDPQSGVRRRKDNLTVMRLQELKRAPIPVDAKNAPTPINVGV